MLQELRVQFIFLQRFIIRGNKIVDACANNSAIRPNRTKSPNSHPRVIPTSDLGHVLYSRLHSRIGRVKRFIAALQPAVILFQSWSSAGMDPAAFVFANWSDPRD